ncbi:sulfatase-like hydrolase/transferase [Roseibacillus ishigakijimensis]|uniref:Sulfatase-like hydrolase/transferase n=1 Tax=Roseibacillus ishigakijimensis TaxID=454146 RepID=A0A934VKY1_9BACT|nr:sulfatase-like hydrolase/transferase [Roseibacillus ishigakijimensis]MBK1832652.1 sulfatase-like hydrolase/transferase [Roseibacillus ishigakijimensis]
MRVLVFFLLLVGSLAARDRRPNVIFIITDDQRREQLGYLEGKSFTPHLDRLAREGADFQNSYTSSTVCTPSRYTCLTGRYPSRSTAPQFLQDITPEGTTQVYFNTHLEKDRPNLPKALQAAGYTTGLVGKWHVGHQAKLEHAIPPNSDPRDSAVRKVLQDNQNKLCADLAEHGFDHVSRVYAGNPLDSKSLRNTGLAHHNMEWITEGALAFIEANRDNPFFLYFSTTLPHSPSPLEGMESDPRSTPVGLLENAPAPEGMPSREEIFRRVTQEAGLPRERAPDTWLDAGIGAILQKIENLGLSEDTLIIYFNDHGMELASKSSLYQGALRTPSSAYWPGTISPQKPEELVSNVDIAPTILEACGAKPLPGMTLDGASYLPLLRGEKVKWRKEVYAEIGFTRALVTKDWKYLAFRLPPSQQPEEDEGWRQQVAELAAIKERHPWVTWEPDPSAKVSHVGGPPGGNFLIRLTMKAKPPYLTNYYAPDQLYHLASDPSETTNLANEEEHRERLQDLQQALQRKLRELPGTFGELKPTEVAHITIHPQITRAIEGESTLQRERYFGICDPGARFPQRVGNRERYRYLVDELDINFGRSLGPVKWQVRRLPKEIEDTGNPGRADLAKVTRFLQAHPPQEERQLQKDFPQGLDVIAHGSPGGYPDFMGNWRPESLQDQPQKKGAFGIPANSQAAAEFAATVFKYGYDDFTRPRYFEPINEPSWQFLAEPERMARWHLETRAAFRAAGLETLVGGPCHATGYLWSRQYQGFKGMKGFIDATRGELDFYSFHVYDYYRWDGDKLAGTMVTGLPFEGVLDLYGAYTRQQFGKTIPLAISEHGGYLGGDSWVTLDKVARAHGITSENPARDRQVRSIQEFCLVTSAARNTLTFMDHPQLVLKAVPFMLLETSSWDPEYYAVLYTKKGFAKDSPELVPTAVQHFHQLFRGVRGERVWADNPDPDVITRVVRDGTKLFIMMHNQADLPAPVELTLPVPEAVVLRRLSRRPNLTPHYREEAATLRDLTLAPQETVVAICHYPAPLAEKSRWNERTYYGDKVLLPAPALQPVALSVDQPERALRATLRIGFSRPVEAGKELVLHFNGRPLALPVEDAAPRLEQPQDHGYATTRMVSLDPAWLKDQNEVKLAFADGGAGTVGSVALRVAYPAPQAGQE